MATGARRKFLSVAFLTKTNERLSRITVNGRVTNVNKLGSCLFLHLNDGRSPSEVQAVIPRGKRKCSQIVVGSTITLCGDWIESRGRQQSMELLVDSYEILGTNSKTLPLRLKKTDSLTGDTTVQCSDDLRQNIHLRPIHQSFASLLRLRAALNSSLHRWFSENDFVHVDTSLLTQNDCENAGQTFTAEAECSSEDQYKIEMDQSENFKPYRFFDRQVYLSVSSQLQLEAVAGGLAAVYTISPAFRAEKCLSRQHLAEFRMLEAEIAYTDDLESIMQIVENCLVYCASQLKLCTDDMECMRKVYRSDDCQPCLLEDHRLPLPRIDYDKALEILHSSNENFETKPTKETGLKKEHENYLVRHFNGPVFVTEFPASLKPFYMKRSDDGKRALCFDLLGPNCCEVAGGSVRENCPQMLRQRIGSMSQLDWYADLRDYGSPISCGFGIGIERLMQMFLGIAHIRDTLAFPRWYKRCDM